VNADPNITTQPTGATVCVGGSAPLSVVAAGGVGTLTYQWQSSTTSGGTFSNVTTGTGGTTANYTPVTSTAGTTYYKVIVSNTGDGCNPVTSNEVSVVVDPTSVGGTATPSPGSICSGGTSTITLTFYTGSIQWQTNESGSFVDIPGETSASYVTPALTVNTKYRAIVTSGVCSSSTSTEATVTIYDDPTLVAPNDYGIEGCDTTSITGWTYSGTIPVDITSNYTGVQITNVGSGIKSVSYIDTMEEGTCPIVVTRTFTVTDNCGNTGTDIQKISINDTTAPVFDQFDWNVSVDYGSDTTPTGTGTPTALDLCDEAVEITNVDNTCFGDSIDKEVNAGTNGQHFEFNISGMAGLNINSIKNLNLTFETNQGKGRAEFILVAPNGRAIVLVGPYCQAANDQDPNDANYYCEDGNANTTEVYSPNFKDGATTIWKNYSNHPVGAADYKPAAAIGEYVSPNVLLINNYFVPNTPVTMVDSFSSLTAGMTSLDGTWAIFAKKQNNVNGNVKFLGVCLTPELGDCGGSVIIRHWTATDDCDNSTSQDQIIVVNPYLLIAEATGTNVSCNGLSDGSASIIASDGVAPYTYLWSDGQTGVTATNLTAGSYSVTVTDSNGCTATDSVTINEPPVINMQTSFTNATCNGETDGTITVTAVEGATITVDDVAYDVNATYAAGTYTVLVTVPGGNEGDPVCSDTIEITIGEPPVINMQTSFTNATCNGEADGTITVTAVEGATITVDDVAYDANATYAAGTYTVLVTVPGGNEGDPVCSDTIEITIGEPAALLATATKVDVLCFGYANGSIDLTVSGGTPTYLYSWTKTGDETFSASTEDLTGLTAGTYNYSVTDLNQCTAVTGIVIINQPLPVPAPISGGNQIVCSNGSPTQTLTATATGGTIIWYTAATGGSLVANPTQVGVGSVTYYAQSSNGICSSLTRTAVTLTINAAPDAPISGGNQTVCSDGTTTQTLTATATGGTITWYTAATGGSLVASPTQVGVGSATYYAQSSNGTCSSLTRTAVTLTINAVPDAPISGGNQTVCSNGSPTQTLTATATGGTITWYTAATGGSVVANPTQTGVGSATYYAQSSNGTCSSLTRTAVTLTINAVPDAPISGGNQTVCSNGSPTQTLTATATGGTITWYTAATGGSVVANPTQTGVGSATYYTESSNGTCSSLTRTAVTLTINATPVVTISGNSVLNCINESTTLTASATVQGTPSYLWSTGATTSTINVTAAGNYSVTVTDGNSGCSSVATVTVTGNATPPAASISGNAVLTCTTQSATLVATATVSGTASYLWNTGDTTASITVSAPGEYSVVVLDSSNGCAATATVTVAQNTTPPVVNISGPTELNCNAASITLNASGATVQGTASYLWNTGATTASIVVNQAGEYTVVVTDSGNGCSGAKTITVTENFVAAEIEGGSIALCIEDSSLNLTSLLPSNFVSGGTWTDDMNSGGLSGSSFDPSVVNLGDFEFTYTEPGDCGRIITVFVNVNDECVVLACSTAEDISKVVTPNGDGINDVFSVGDISAGNTCKYIVKIFNRWGKMVYHSDNYLNNWSGRHDGSGMKIGSNSELPTGTYYYIVNIIDTGGSSLKPITGYIYLGTH